MRYHLMSQPDTTWRLWRDITLRFNFRSIQLSWGHKSWMRRKWPYCTSRGVNVITMYVIYLCTGNYTNEWFCIEIHNKHVFGFHRIFLLKTFQKHFIIYVNSPRIYISHPSAHSPTFRCWPSSFSKLWCSRSWRISVGRRRKNGQSMFHETESTLCSVKM